MTRCESTTACWCATPDAGITTMQTQRPSLARASQWCCLLLLGTAALPFLATAEPVAPSAPFALATTDPVTVLGTQHQNLRAQLAHNVYQQPLVLASTESAKGLQGDVYAEMAYPLDVLSTALRQPEQWCEVMILHINTKYCRAESTLAGTRLNVNIGSKTPQELGDTARLSFTFSVVAATPDYLEVLLEAADGPLGTSDYRIRLEAIALPQQRSFLHLTYAYAVNLLGRLAMQTYLATVGAGKVGFTLIDNTGGAPPTQIGGVRGLVERNTMRYYLAINSFFEAAPSASGVSKTSGAQLEQRLQSWFSATETYPRQLHETDRAAYLEMKHAEHQRQQLNP